MPLLSNDRVNKFLSSEEAELSAFSFFCVFNKNPYKSIFENGLLSKDNF